MDATSTGVYIVQRAATFFQAILANKVNSLGTTRFVECENKRYRCFLADQYSCPGGKDPGADCPPPQQ